MSDELPKGNEGPGSSARVDLPKVEVTIGTTPRFWDRNVTFVANLLGLFFGNEEETRMLAREVGEVDSYGGRLLPILNLLYAGSDLNLLVLERAPDPFLSEYFESRAGLSLPEVAILSHREYLELGNDLAQSGVSSHPVIEKIGSHATTRVDGYVTDETLSALASLLGKSTISSMAGSRRGNNKGLLHSHLEACGLPVPMTEIAEETGEVRTCLASLERAGFESAVIKAPMGASGIGMTKVDSLADCEGIANAVPEHFFTEGPCLVQGWLKPGQFGITEIRSPSVQLFLADDRIALYDVTEQILSHDSVHEGNESPPPYLGGVPGLREELLRQASLSAQWLHGEGYRGTGSVDFLVTMGEGDSFTVYVCEINARVTGATYPSVLARHFLPEGAWLLRNLRFEEALSGNELLEMLEQSGDLYLPGETEFGVLPVNFNFGTDGLIHKGQFLCLASTVRKSEELLEMAELDLPCQPDRD